LPSDTDARTAFTRYIGIDYFRCAQTPEASLEGASGLLRPTALPQPKRWRHHRARASTGHDASGVAEWLAERAGGCSRRSSASTTGFRFRCAISKCTSWSRDWPKFLEDFQRHWPTNTEHTYVDFVRDGLAGNGAARAGNTRWRRMTEQRAGSAKSVFHFNVQGSVAKSTHAGRAPALLYLRRHLGSRLHFWPFDGWSIPHEQVCRRRGLPSLWKHAFPADDRTPDQHDAYAVASWLSEADRSGRLERFLQPNLTLPERMVAGVEGWILGVG
jgi:hypothetical protein